MLYDEKMAFLYLERLFLEIDSYNIEKVSTIYLGGGTPSSLNTEMLTLLLKKIRPFLDEGGEFSVEINVENTNFEKLQLLKSYSVNRLSIGVQSTNDAICKFLNRQHTFEDVKKVVKEARMLGFYSINLDLIYGISLQSKKVLQTDIDNLLSLHPEHISIYSLTVHPNTVFYLKGINEQNQDDSRDDYDLILNSLRKAGYDRYEISNFAKPGFRSRHNLTYWLNEEYYGVGMGASGYVDGVRYDNTRNMCKYLQGFYRSSEEKITIEDEEKYFWMLNLRLEDGFEIQEYVNRFGTELLLKREETLHDEINNGLMIKLKNRIKLGDDGLMILDRILLKII